MSIYIYHMYIGMCIVDLRNISATSQGMLQKHCVNLYQFVNRLHVEAQLLQPHPSVRPPASGLTHPMCCQREGVGFKSSQWQETLSTVLGTGIQ